MLEINAAFGQEGKNLGLVGRTGENASRRIVFDCEAVLGEFPGAGIVCALRRACDAEAYAKELTTDGKKRLLTLSAADVAAPGSLMIELRAVEADAIRKSAVYVGRIERGLSGQGDAPGNPVADTINNLEARAKAASAAAAAAQAVADEVQERLEAGEFKGDKGDPGKDGAPGKDGSDANVTAENIEAALGYAPAKVPQSVSWGIINNVNGEIALNPASNNTIDSRTTRQPITTGNFDYAVTAAMTDGKGPAWTAAQQAAARNRMGIPGDYELIEELVLAEESRVVRSKELDGTPYNFAVIMLRAEFPASEKTGNIYIAYDIGNHPAAATSYFLSPYKADAVKYGYSKIWVENSRYRSGWWTCAEKKGQFAQYYENPVQQDKYSIADGNITAFSTDVMAAGTKITIYGVRAQ